MSRNRISQAGFPWIRVRQELETLKMGKGRKYDDVCSINKMRLPPYYIVPSDTRKQIYVSRVWGVFI